MQKLTIENLTHFYQKAPAVNRLSVELTAGKTCLLLGPNGSGKTTMMKIIAGLTRPSQGSVLLDGEPVGTKTKARIAYMPTESYFYPGMSVRDAGKYYADFFRDFNFKRYAAIIDRAELAMQSRVRSLSSGMNAKLRLSLILSRDAEIMMFDEPINGVDLITRDWVLSEIAARKREDRLLLISSHLVEEAEAIADYALFIKKGELVEAGTLENVCRGESLTDRYREIFRVQPVGEIY